jgi:hypothetical protein
MRCDGFVQIIRLISNLAARESTRKHGKHIEVGVMKDSSSSKL